MKNQYFGDINDYRKYGLIRILTGSGILSTAICWMLTPNDRSPDGKFITYLGQHEKWRKFDSEIYEKLRDAVNVQGIRDVKWADKIELIPFARYYNEELKDNRVERAHYFERFWNLAEGADLIFFDPDNGIEVKSKPYGQKHSSKYLYWKELEQAFSNGHSVLVYQHFPFIKRDVFISQMSEQIRNRTGARTIYSFRTAHVVFFLLPSAPHVADFEERISRIPEIWGNQIQWTV